MIRVLVAEDQHLIRGALVALLSLESDITVVAETARGDAVPGEIERSRPDVAVLDADLSGTDAITVAEQLRASGSPVRVLVLTGLGGANRGANTIERAVRAGVSGFLAKDAPTEQLSRAIREVNAGRRFIDVESGADTMPAMMPARMPARMPASAPPASEVDPLSARERGILAALYNGATLRTLRAALGLSGATLQAHLNAALCKTGCVDTYEAARIAYDRGWLETG
jgi:two-component system response regulator DesR